MEKTERKLARKRGNNFELSVAKKVHGVRVGRSKAVNVDGIYIQVNCQQPPDVINQWASFECKSRKDIPKWLRKGMTQAIRNAPMGHIPHLVIYDREERCTYIVQMFPDWLDLHER
jgi:hypothetical protein